ncbi:hypothetical protein GPA19_10125 [Azoarcus indigens]|uniref:VanZ family protein n=1 Tax=Azoarcus indigens TaxID=29545 RepID=A0A4R6EH06_9RHOO|nr:VanZ family protein [Azoarcus indigens]NMG65303.1 hypothetical protein [Azoarcus indigens]TDN56687.1 VanZ family protein [Azoarcus indigens]
MPDRFATVLRLAFAAALVAVFVLALLPTPDLVQFVSWQDKIEHAGVFATLSLLGLAAWPQHAGRLALALLAYGAAIEIAQSFTGYRMGDPWDWLADAVGVAVLLPALMWRRRPTPGAA